MLASALIVFREVLEAALIIGIVFAATAGVARRGRWIIGGLLAGLIGSVVVAFFAGAIADSVQGMGQELLNAGVLFTAVGFLGWHNIWMHRHGQEIAKRLKAVGASVMAGETPLVMLATIVGLAVLREGSEVALFLYGIAAAGGAQGSSLVVGGFLGLVAGAALGFIIYFGLVHIPMKRLFQVTGTLILLLAAGMAAQGAGFLVQAGILPDFGGTLWDSSHLLSQSSIFGQLLHTLIGYEDRPMGIQLVFYVVTAGVISLLMRLSGRTSTLPVVVVLLLATGITAALILPTPASATQKVYYPTVNQGEVEAEFLGHYDSDNNPALDKGQKYKFELGYGVTNFWMTEAVVEVEKAAQDKTRLDSFEWENIFQLTPQGKYWLDAGVLASVEFPANSGQPHVFEFGPLLQKQFGKMLNTANLVFVKETGSNAHAPLQATYAWQTKWLVSPYFEPGFEAYGDFGDVNKWGIRRDQTQQAGPAVFGSFNMGPGQKLRYEAGLLFGLNAATPGASLKWLLEYEFFF
jgi:FTR1 family protein